MSKSVQNSSSDVASNGAESVNAGSGVSSPDGSPETPPPSPTPPKGPRLTVVFAFLVVAAAFLAIGFYFGPGLKKPASNGGSGDVMSGGHDHGSHGGVRKPMSDETDGLIKINPVVVQNMGVRIDPVVQGPLVKTIRTVGTIEYDETRVGDVNIKVQGWIEDLLVDYEGAKVKKNDVLFSIYAPQLYAAQEEYLLAWKNKDKIGADFVPDAAKGAQALLESARVKLEYFDITSEQIEALQKTGKPSKTMTIESPHEGIVIEKHVFKGMKVDPGMRVYRIADLSEIWVMVTLYEHQLPFVSVDQPAVMTLSYIPGQVFKGKVIYIYPYLDRKTRQVQVRLEFENPHDLLKPGMFANIELRGVQADDATLVPRSAIIDTGRRQVAFVSRGEGKFEPRDVRIGIETDAGLVQVLRGLEPGEMVVTSGQFMLDSEARVREALVKRTEGTLATESAPKRVMLTSELTSLPEPAAQLVSQILDVYFAMGNTLATGNVEGVNSAAEKMAEHVDALLKVNLTDKPKFWDRHATSTIRQNAIALAKTKTLAKARLVYGQISIALSNLVRGTGVPPDYDKPVQEIHCPMYAEGQGGALWLQPDGRIRNPFLGPEMTECYDSRLTLPITGVRPKDLHEHQMPLEPNRDSKSDNHKNHGGADGEGNKS